MSCRGSLVSSQSSGAAGPALSVRETSSGGCATVPLGASPRSRAATVAQGSLEDSDELWLENQDLYAKIADLENKLEELQEDNEELSAMCQASIAPEDMRKNIRRPSVSFKRHTVTSSRALNFADRDKLEALSSQRFRLLWQKAIFAVRLRCTITRHVASTMKLAAVEHQLFDARRLTQELERRMAALRQDSVKQKMQWEAEQGRLREKFAQEKTELELAFKDRTFLMERASNVGSLGLHSSDFSPSLHPSDSRDSSQAGPTMSLLHDLVTRRASAATSGTGSCSSLPPSDAGARSTELGWTSAERSVGLQPRSASRGDGAGGSVLSSGSGAAGLRRALQPTEEQEEDIDKLQLYCTRLESKLLDALADAEDVELYKQRVRQLENSLRLGQMVEQHASEGWWGAFQRSFCATTRPEAALAQSSPLGWEPSVGVATAIRQAGAFESQSVRLLHQVPEFQAAEPR